ncbi:hypothetical protein TRVL_05723 [Trypanosoma vivax]|uniref:RRM domain-containing protein n=1 Tax=Trypanosoma vivax (strain Y486) TaxID=1055687 RepID=G0TV93_TRYVY|nr:hypothetical protein TRVL_05723 [Trypanosoma vivax]CCC47859.1 conserved hypothetical protein [Trypanosoma vivax Y486]
MMLHTSGYTLPTQRGVLFFSSIPRDMRPNEVLMHFNRFGTITRHKFTPFPKKERRPNGPLKPLQFMRGYIEFAHAGDARHAATVMNGLPVSCKRRRRCSGQLWTVKYDAELTWDKLLEERESAARERRQREMEARNYEREINEAYRAAVLGGTRRKHNAKRTKCEDAEGDGYVNVVETAYQENTGHEIGKPRMRKRRLEGEVERAKN